MTGEGYKYKPGTGCRLLTGQEAKRKLHKEHRTVKEWAASNGYNYHLVSGVIRGIVKCTYGKSHEIAVALGMKLPD
ncbi:MAG: DNA-binding protein [Burkholderiaceae bacterium]|jgi:gp16 family phage-associated protein|nr:DNA-binding protein [Burkholderiaceae bacterium]